LIRPTNQPWSSSVWKPLLELLVVLVNANLQATAIRNNPTEAPDSSMSKPNEFTYVVQSTFYQHFFVVFDTGVVKLAVLNPQFVTLLCMNKKASCLQQTNNIIRYFQATYSLRPGVFAFRHARGAGQLLDQPFANAIFQPYWGAQMSSLIFGSEYFLLFGSFGLPPTSNNAVSNKHKMDELRAQRQVDNELHRAHILPEATSLYVRKITDTEANLLATFGNFETFVGACVMKMYAADGAGMPSVIAMTTMIFTLLINEAGRAWTCIMFEKYSNFGKFIMTRMNALVMMYVAIAQAASAVHQSNPKPSAKDYGNVETQAYNFGSEL
jgi:hypothetical protein